MKIKIVNFLHHLFYCNFFLYVVFLLAKKGRKQSVNHPQNIYIYIYIEREREIKITKGGD